MPVNHEIDEILCTTRIDARVSVRTWRPHAWDSAGVLSEGHMLCNVVKGSGSFRISEQDYSVRPGSLLFLRSGDSFIVVGAPPDDLLLYSCQFTVRDSPAFRLLEIPPCIELRDRGLRQMLGELARVFDRGEEDLFSAWCWVYGVLRYYRAKGLLQLDEGPDDPARVALSHMLSFMQANTDKRISVSVLSSLVCRERSFVYRVFRDQLGTTPMEHFRRLQMAKAKQSLYEGKTVKEAAAELGYSDAFSLSKAFKREFGFSPRHFSGARARNGHRSLERTVSGDARRRRLWEVHPRLPLLRARVLGWDCRSFTMGWEDTVAAQGVIQCGKEFSDADMLAWGRAWANYHLELPLQEVVATQEVGSFAARGIVLSGYSGSWGAPLALAPLYEASPSHAYLRAISGTADYILHRALRTADGTIVHGGFTDNVWVDTPYLTSAVLARAYAVTRVRPYAAEAIRQCINHARHLADEATGCYVHDIDLKRGVRSKWLWSRGNGWMFLALADTLVACPPLTKGYDEVLRVFADLAKALVRYQHPSGLWRIIIDDPDAHLETSGSATILSALAIGIENRWLDECLLDKVLQGFQELLSWIHPESGPLQGAFMGSEKPAGPGGWEQHKYVELGECTYATGLFLRLLVEVRRLGITVQF